MTIQATVNYHIKSDEPQAFHFDVGGKIGNLISPELVTTEIEVQDLRDADYLPNFEADGITFVTRASQVKPYTDSSDWKSVYETELELLLKEEISAKEVIIFDHTIRIDDPQATRGPARNVHNDYNKSGAEQRLIDLVGAKRADEFRKSGYGFVNIWRPLENTIKSSPLGFIHPNSVQPDDWMDIGLVYPDRFGQILGVAANEAHNWFFKSEMGPDEAVIFNIYDTGGRPHLAHSALDLPTDVHAKVPRKSIESRTLVRYS